MKIATIAALAVLCAGPAVAASVEMPPSRYDREPTKPYTLVYASQAEVDAMCSFEVALASLKNYRPGKKASAWGCTDVETRTVLILKTLSKKRKREVWLHERAHLNGWRH